MGVEDVDVVQAQAPEGLVAGGDEVLAGAASLPVGARPHVVTRFGTDDELVTVGLEVGGQDAAEVDLRLTVGRTVVVGEIEVGDATVEGTTQHGTLGRPWVKVSEVVPQAQGDGKQQQTAGPATSVLHGVVAILGCPIGAHCHGLSVPTVSRGGSKCPGPRHIAARHDRYGIVVTTQDWHSARTPVSMLSRWDSRRGT